MIDMTLELSHLLLSTVLQHQDKPRDRGNLRVIWGSFTVGRPDFSRIRCLVHFHGRERLAAGRFPVLSHTNGREPPVRCAAPGLCETRHTRPKMYPQFSILNSQLPITPDPPASVKI
jgi:hypothetical protein